MRRPKLLDPTNAGTAEDVLRCYYGHAPHHRHGAFTGARFDDWDSLGTRESDWNRFTADDVVASAFLAVPTPGAAVARLLDTHAAQFTEMLEELGPDRDLVEETEPWPDDWVGWRLWSALVALPDIGPTRASKLYARKRPRLRPIYDTVVADVIGRTDIWTPLRETLQADPDLHLRLVRLRDAAGLPQAVSSIRVFDVLAWMEGKGTYVPCPW